MKYLRLLAASLVTGLLAFGLLGGPLQGQGLPTATPASGMMGGMSGMSGMMAMNTQYSSDELAPLVRGLYNGEDVFFVHTEASDPDIARLLTQMMGPQVVAVPSLAEIPEELLGSLFVFTNGVSGDGPMGFQPDVFDSIPGDEAYTPLRAVHLVTWDENAAARELVSVEAIRSAEEAGEIVIEEPDIVINMPILVWPGGHR